VTQERRQLLAQEQSSRCTEARDQRGASRDALCDIGAFERSAAAIMNSATGAGAVTFQTSAGAFASFHPLAEANMPNQAGKPAGVTFPYGFFEWSIQLPAAGGTADVAMTFPAAVPTPAQYWKVIDGIWRNLCLQLACAVAGNTLTIPLGDGASQTWTASRTWSSSTLAASDRATTVSTSRRRSSSVMVLMERGTPPT